jgi:hypothetical protein
MDGAGAVRRPFSFILRSAAQPLVHAANYKGSSVKKKLFLVVFLTAAPLFPASAMDVATFVAKADVLEKKGVTALFSSDFKLLKAEVQTAATQLRNERAAAQKAGKPMAYCPPAKSALAPKEILAHFRAIPAAQRPRTQVKDGLRSLLARKWPCRR